MTASNTKSNVYALRKSGAIQKARWLTKAIYAINQFLISDEATKNLDPKHPKKAVNVIYEPCHWFSCLCAFSKVTVNVLDVIVVRKLSPSKLLCLPPHLIDCHL